MKDRLFHAELLLYALGQLSALLRVLAAGARAPLLPEGILRLRGGHHRHRPELLHRVGPADTPFLGLPARRLCAQAAVPAGVLRVHLHLCGLHHRRHADVLHPAARRPRPGLRHRHGRGQHGGRRHHAGLAPRRGSGLLRSGQQHGHEHRRWWACSCTTSSRSTGFSRAPCCRACWASAWPRWCASSRARRCGARPSRSTGLSS